MSPFANAASAGLLEELFVVELLGLAGEFAVHHVDVRLARLAIAPDADRELGVERADGDVELLHAGDRDADRHLDRLVVHRHRLVAVVRGLRMLFGLCRRLVLLGLGLRVRIGVKRIRCGAGAGRQREQREEQCEDVVKPRMRGQPSSEKNF